MRRMTFGLALGAVAALLVAGCGFRSTGLGSSAATPAAPPSNGQITLATGGGGKLVSRSIVTSASALTTAGTTGRFAITVDESVAGRSMVVAMTGSYDTAHRAMALTEDLSQALNAIPGNADPKVKADMKKVLGDGKMETRTIGNVIYIRSPMFGQLLGTGKPWLKSDASDKTTNLFGSTAAPGGPESFLALLEGVSDDVRQMDTATIRGVPTTHYRATFNADRALRQVPAAERARVQAMLDDEPGMRQALAIPIEAWIDHQGHVRRIRTATSFDDDGTWKATITEDFFDLGAPVTIVAPPADQTVDAKDIEKQFTKKFGPIDPTNTDPSNTDATDSTSS